MNYAKLVEQIEKQHKADMEVLAQRGRRYSPGEDALENLRGFGFLGIVVRLYEKFNRLKGFVLYSEKDSDEAIEETLLDIRNYCHLGEALLAEKSDKIKSEQA